MQQVRAALIGCGPRGASVARAAADGGALDLRYACDSVEERARGVAEALKLQAVTDPRAVLDDSEVEAVLIVTDVGSHLPLVREALAARKHVIVEKPLGDDIAAARTLAAEAERSGLVAYVSFQLRFLPQFRLVREALPALDAVQVFFGRSRGMLKPQFLNPSPFCGIMDVCAHDFDLVSWFMGRPPVAATAVLRRNTFTRDTGAVDTLSALIDFCDGRSATVVSSVGAKEIGMKCDIAGARGNVSLDGSGAPRGVRFDAFDSQGAKTPLEFDRPSAQSAGADVELHRAFQREIREGVRSHAARLADGVNSLLLSSACLRSAEEGRRVALGELGT